MYSSSFHRAIYASPFLLACCLVAASLCSCSGKGSEVAANDKPKPKPNPGTPSGVKPTPPVAPPVKITFEHPDAVKGIYLTAWTAGSSRLLDRYMKLIDATELNAVVIDIRDSGEMYFPTQIPLADEVEGKKYLAVTKPGRLMKTLSDHHVWPIARVACFRDNHVPLKHPDRAVQMPDGTPWHDRSKHYWLDPYDKRNWEYLAQTVEYAMKIGFPEIQLDYVRFPSEGKSSSQVFPNKKKYDDPKAKPEDVIKAFASYIRDKVKAQNCMYSADIFGIISSGKSDQGIGQELEKIAEPFDVVSPMVYPSHFALGEYGIANPNKSPYAIISKSLRDYKRRIPKKGVRPWLQAFSLGGVHYGGAEIRAQIKATNDQGYDEFLLWNAGNKYSKDGLLAKGKTETIAKVDGPPTDTPEKPPGTKAVEPATTIHKSVVPGSKPVGTKL